jgi:hypothetical protein
MTLPNSLPAAGPPRDESAVRPVFGHPTPQLRDILAFASALVLYALFYAAFFFKSLTSGEYIAPSDSLDFGLAAFLSSPALWTEGMYSGYPIAADPQSLTWYPVLQLIRLLGLGWNTFMVIPYVVASAGCFLLVRRLTSSTVAGAFSGFVFGFSGVMLGHIGHFNQIHAAAWLPLVVYGLQLMREGSGRLGAVVASIAFALMWTSGHPQVAVYTLYLSAALVFGWLLIDRPVKSIVLTRVAWPVLAIALGVGLAAITVVPMIELGEFSRRAAQKWEVYASKALPAWQLLSLVFPFAFGGFRTTAGLSVPYFGEGGPVENTGYVGLLPFMLAMAGPFVLSSLRKDGSPPKLHAKAEARLWLIVAAIAALLCLGAATPIGTLFFYAPGYASFRVPARHLFVVTFCLAVASGLTFAQLASRGARRGMVAASFSAMFLLAALAFAAFAWRTPDVRDLIAHNRTYAIWAIAWPLALATMLVACILAGRFVVTRASMLAFAVLLIAVQLADMAMLHYHLPPYRFEYADVPPEQVAPHPRIAALSQVLHRTGERVLAVDGSKNQFLLPNLTRAWAVPAASGTGSLGIERYLDVLGMGGPGDVYPETLSAQHHGLDLFAIRYALVPQGSSLADDLRRQEGRWSVVEHLRYYEHDPDTHYTLFRNARAGPRAWCASGIVRASADEALAAIRSGHLPQGRQFSPAEVALVEAGTARDGVATAPAAQGSTVVAAHLNGQHRYLVSSASSCLLVLSEVYYPWWRGSLDGSPVTVSRVNHTMIGIPVPPGSHVVRLWLEPRSVWIGAATTLASFLIWIGLVRVRSLRRPSWRRRTSDTPAWSGLSGAGR